MISEQPKPDSKKPANLIQEIDNGTIKIPKFQRDFVWSIDKTAGLLDSILKGYPIGTFILWETSERINNIKNIGNLELPELPAETKVQYVLDGQQRITSFYAAYKGVEIQKPGDKKVTDYKDIFVNLGKNADENNEQIITAKPPPNDKHVSLHDVLNFSFTKAKELSGKFNDEELEKINSYSTAFKTYEFSIVVLKKEDIDSAIEVFTRINTGGQVLTLFEIMSAKTYDENQGFDMQEKWEKFIEELEEIKYEGISSSVALTLLSLTLSSSKECKRKTILSLRKQDIIDNWDLAISALRSAVEYFRRVCRIPVSQLLPYDFLLVPFAYFFYRQNEGPQAEQQKYLEEFFWRMALSFRYSGPVDSALSKDIRRIDSILKKERPDYSDIKVHLDSPESLIETNFNAGNSYCKAVLCLLAYRGPKDFRNSGNVVLENAHLKMASSKSYHYFFPRTKRSKTGPRTNSVVNITLVNSDLKKKKIASRLPSDYIDDFKSTNPNIDKTLDSHFIGSKSFGIETDDHETFLKARAERIFNELKSRIDLAREEYEEEDIGFILGGESDVVEFKSTLRYDLREGKINKKVEYGVVKTIAAFLNGEGGDLFIGIDDNQNALGLSSDIETLTKKKNIDGFELHLVGVIKKYFGAGRSHNIKITFPIYDDTEICRVRVEKSNEPVFTEFEGEQHFFVRLGCSSQPLSRKEQARYQRAHWGK